MRLCISCKSKKKGKTYSPKTITSTMEYHLIEFQKSITNFSNRTINFLFAPTCSFTSTLRKEFLSSLHFVHKKIWSLTALVRINKKTQGFSFLSIKILSAICFEILTSSLNLIENKIGRFCKICKFLLLWIVE